MSQAMGSLTNAPLAFVLAQVRVLLPSTFNRSEVSQAMHGDLFPHFPRKQEITSQRLVIEADGSPVVQSGEVITSLASLDHHEELLITPSFLSLQATRYESYPVFTRRLSEVVRAMFQHFGPLAIQQVGLRYIDFVYPRIGEQLTEYLPAAASLVELPGTIAETCLRAADLTLHNARAVIRITQGIGRASLPADLGPLLSLAPSAIMARDPGLVPTAVLDIDCFTNVNMQELTDPDAVMRRFQKLHDEVAASVFQRLVTDKAMSYWKEQS